MHRDDEFVHPDHGLREVIVRMKRTGVSFLPVVESDEIVGVIEAEEIVSRLHAENQPAATASVRDYMSTEAMFCAEHDDLESADALAERDGHQHLIVVDAKRRLIGTLSRDEIARHLAGRRGAPTGAVSKLTKKRHLDTSGRAKGGKKGRPPAYSIRPKVKD